MNEYIMSAVIGLFAGVAGGVLGIGGGIIMIPALVMMMGYSQHLAQGTTLAAMIPPIGLLAAYAYYEKGYVNIPIACLIAVGFLLGGYAGGKIAVRLDPIMLKRVFSAALVLIAVKIFTGTLSKQ